MKIKYQCTLVQEDMFGHKESQFKLVDKIVQGSEEFKVVGDFKFTPGDFYCLEITGPVVGE